MPEKRTVRRVTIALALLALVTSMVYLESLYRQLAVADKTETYEQTYTRVPVTDEEWAAQPHYNPDLLRRYKTYYNQNFYLSVYEVVWHVNVRLDYSPYLSMVVLESDNPFLITQRYRLPKAFEPLNLVKIDNNIYAVPDAAEAFAAMQAAADNAGYDITATSGYRSFQEQGALYYNNTQTQGHSYADVTVAKAGSSEHQTGRALDIQIEKRNSSYAWWQAEEDAQNWLRDNAPDYGFISRYADWNTTITGYYNEPWHLTYVGKDIAFDMMRRGIATLEEYVGSLPYGTDWDSLMETEGEQ